MAHFVGTFLIPGGAPHAVAIQDRVHTALRVAAGGDPTEAAPYPDVTMQSPIVDYVTDSARFHVWFTAPDQDAAERRLSTAVAIYPTARDVRVEEPHTI